MGRKELGTVSVDDCRFEEKGICNVHPPPQKYHKIVKLIRNCFEGFSSSVLLWHYS